MDAWTCLPAYPGHRMSGSAQSLKQEEVPVEVSETLVLKSCCFLTLPWLSEGHVPRMTRGLRGCGNAGGSPGWLLPVSGLHRHPSRGLPGGGPAPQRSQQRVPSACRA